MQPLPEVKDSSDGSARSLLWVTWVILVWMHFGSACLDLKAQVPNPGRALVITESGKSGFTLLPPSATGIAFTNQLALERSITNHVLLNGSGVAAGDVDGDGWVDLYFCNLDGPNQLYRNLGSWHFTNITDSAGVACPELDATGAALADLDGDGDLDLVVNSIGAGTRLFLNDGRGHFSPSPRSPVLNAGNAGTSMALADMDGDGALDLYITNYQPMFFFLDKAETRYSIRMVDGQPRVALIDGRPVTDPEFTNRFVFQVQMADGKVTFAKEELGQVDHLYRNDGQGGFELVPFTGGKFLDEDGRPLHEPPRDWGLSVAFRDLNGDGAPDIYVCNDFRTPDRIWMNDGRGTFRALPRLALRQTCLSAMGMDVADVNRDGSMDLFVADMLSTDHGKRLRQRIDIRPETLPVGEIDNRPQFSRNVLQLNRGDGTYAEIAQFAGLQASDWTWSPTFLDVDLDGYEDVILGNGFERDTMNVDLQHRIEQITRQKRLGPREKMNLRKLYPRLDTPNLAFRNLGDCRFRDMSAEWGFDTRSISQGLCLADLDNDGDLDVVVNNFNGPAGLYRNNSPAARVAVRLRGLPPNSRGIGARIELLGGPVYQSQEMIAGGRYCSSDDPLRTFAAGSSTNSMTLIVTWRSGQVSVIHPVAPNRLYVVEEASARAPEALRLPHPISAQRRPSSPTSASAPAFKDVSSILAHSHHESPFDDFQRQPLLPSKLSQLGPGLCWYDLDGDGWEDLVIANGAGAAPAEYHNGEGHGFQVRTSAQTGVSWSDQTAVVGWISPSGKPAVLVGISNYESAQPDPPAVRSHSENGWSHLVPGSSSACGPLAVADLDGDGDLDLFVGGRVVPGRYPEPATSRLFRNQEGILTPDSANRAVFEKIGLVTGAVFSDLDNDGDPDLVLSCEWGPIRVFGNDKGRLTEITRELGLEKRTGWWNGVAVGDFDGDGAQDIVASNCGQNSRYELFRAHPLRLYYGDLVGDGSVQTLEAYVDPATGKWVPWRRFDAVAKALPFLQARFETFEAFGSASLDEILDGRAQRATVLEATTLETTVFWNRQSHFEPAALPMEAQLAPAFAICVGDFDGDGAEDIFLSQNFFDVQTEMSRCDAGRGLWLRGNGRGSFQPVSGRESGILVYGEQRGAALCDYDHDGRVDLAVTQNGAETKLLHNETARPGLRVRLKGTSGNPFAIGAQLRSFSKAGPGPVREVHGGSGYWSQDSPTQVLAAPGRIERVEVRWPGGATTAHEIPVEAKEVELSFGGSSRVVH